MHQTLNTVLSTPFSVPQTYAEALHPILARTQIHLTAILKGPEVVVEPNKVTSGLHFLLRVR